MKTDKKTILIASAIVVFVIVVCIVVYIYYKKKKEAAGKENEPGPQPFKIIEDIIKPDPLAGLPTGKLPLKLGDKNKLTGILQMSMNDLYNSRLIVDGDFGTGLRDTLKLRYNKTECDYNLAKTIYKQLYEAKQNEAALNLFYNSFIS